MWVPTTWWLVLKIHSSKKKSAVFVTNFNYSFFHRILNSNCIAYFLADLEIWWAKKINQGKGLALNCVSKCSFLFSFDYRTDFAVEFRLSSVVANFSHWKSNLNHVGTSLYSCLMCGWKDLIGCNALYFIVAKLKSLKFQNYPKKNFWKEANEEN